MLSQQCPRRSRLSECRLGLVSRARNSGRSTRWSVLGLFKWRKREGASMDNGETVRRIWRSCRDGTHSLRIGCVSVLGVIAALDVHAGLIMEGDFSPSATVGILLTIVLWGGLFALLRLVVLAGEYA